MCSLFVSQQELKSKCLCPSDTFIYDYAINSIFSNEKFIKGEEE